MTIKKTEPKRPAKLADSPFGENTVLTITIPAGDHKKAYSKALARAASLVTLPGFRKGKAPTKLVEESVGPSKLLEHALELLLPEAYDKVVKEAKVLPLVQPKVEAKELPVDGNWVLEATTAVAPQVTLGDWQSIIKDAAKTFVKEHKGHKHEEGHDEKQERLSRLFGALIAKLKIKIPPMLFEAEVDRQIGEFAKHLASHKIDLETFLKNSGKTVEDLRMEYATNSLTSLQLEFILHALTLELKPEVTKKEIETLLGDITKYPESSKERLEAEAKSVLIRKKTVESLEKIADAA